MALVDAKCTNCNGIIQLDDNVKTNYCSYCGGRIIGKDAIAKFQAEEEPQRKSKQRRIDAINSSMVDEKLNEAYEFISNRSFAKAERLFIEILESDPDNSRAQWGIILVKTKNLEAVKLDAPDDFCWTLAQDLFENSKDERVPQWRLSYEEAYYKACVFTADSYDVRVFMELEVFRWNNKENRFEFPINRTFDIDSMLEKTVQGHLVKLLEVMPPEKQSEYKGIIEQACRDIHMYFESGFEQLENIRAGNISKLLGTWQVKKATSDNKCDVIRFSLNSVNVLHCEYLKVSYNHYDLFRFVKLDANNSLTCRESRHFPSSLGAGGDFYAYDAPHPFLNLFAIYDFLLVMPNALFSRVDFKSIPNIDRAVVFQKKCLMLTSFLRNGPKGVVQIRPICENYETADPSKKVSACYIATAVYGDVQAGEVMRLRRFRDETLHRYRLGRKFTDWYYRHSPVWAERLKDAGLLNKAVKAALNAFIKLLG